ncbi:MAG: hypothetical protein AAGI15_01230 [Pseudomonadota bacterium]
MSYRTVSCILSFLLALAAAPSAIAQAPSVSPCQSAPVTVLPLEEMSASGNARLCVLPERLRARGVLNDLVPGNAYTVWWVYIDQPGECQGGFAACVEAFFLDANPRAVFGLMDSGIASRRGQIYFEDTLNGMDPTRNAQVWYLVFGHGPADRSDGRRLARQLLTPEDPNVGAPFLGVEGEPTGYPVAEAVFTVR